MISVYEDETRRIVRGEERVNFSSFSSFHLIVITARAKGKKQISNIATDDEDLTVRIDGKSFPKLSNSKEVIDSPAAFSGGSLHGLAKTVYLFTFLKGKEHTVELITDAPHNTAVFESIKIYTLASKQGLILKIEAQAEDGNGRPWITIAFGNCSLKVFTATITYSRRKRDSDDVKIIIDGKIQGNILRSIKHFLWRYVGSLLPPFSTKTETEIFTVNFPQGLHYLEFWADRTPILRSLNLDFGIFQPPHDGIPTVDDPAWTKDFYDDTETVLFARTIYGETGGEPYEAKIAVAWSIRNRVEDAQKRWGRNYHEVILQENQYDAFWNKRTYDKVRNPPIAKSKQEREAWEDSYTAAVQVISGETPDPTKGANHFYATTIPTPPWANEKKFTIQVGITRFYRL